MKFGKGFLYGALAGTLIGLLTSKKTGQERQRAIATYVDGITDASQEVGGAVSRLNAALRHLQKEVDETLKPTVKDISDRVTAFEFETEPRLTEIQTHVARIEAATSSLGAETDQSHPTT